jgi:hypothetical protein
MKEKLKGSCKTAPVGFEVIVIVLFTFVMNFKVFDY